MKPHSIFAVAVSLLFVTVALLPVQSFVPAAVVAPVSLGEVVYTVPLRKKIPLETVQREWYHEYIDGLANDSLFKPLFQKVRNKSLTVYQPEYPFTEKINADSAIAMIDIPFTYMMEDLNTFEVYEVIGKDTKHPESIVAIIFHEEWKYDVSTLSLKKIVKGIIPVIDYGLVYVDGMYDARVKPAFYIPFPGSGLQKNDFTLNEITYDMRNDSVGLLDYLTSYRCVSQASTKSPDGSGITADLIVSLKKQCAVKGSALFSANYPFNSPVTKKERSAVLTAVDSAQLLQFHEKWSADFSSMTFTKEVRGVLLGSESATVESNETDLFYKKPSRFVAYLPLNGNRPVLPTVSRPVYIENFSSGAAYQRMPWVIYPLLITNDSVALANTAEALANKGRNGAFPIYDKHAHWQFDDPLDKRRVPLTAVEIDNLFYQRDTVYVEDELLGHNEVLSREQDPTEYAGFKYFESWYFDPSKMIFRKHIKSIGLLRYVTSDYGEVRGVESIFVYDNEKDSIFQPKYLVAKNILSPVLLNWNERHYDENDNGQPILSYGGNFEENITNENRFLLVQQVINSVLSGRAMAWTTTKPVMSLTIAQFRIILDTAAARSGMHPALGREYCVFNELTFDEDWYHHPATGQFYKHVNAITFGHQPYQSADPETGEIRPDPVYFTIKVNGTK